jgi:succinoglycan biosynthesis protein ExoM
MAFARYGAARYGFRPVSPAAQINFNIEKLLRWPRHRPRIAGMSLAPQAHATNQPIRPAVSLCIPTFRRPDGLRKLLAHIAELDYRGPLSVIVVDNDADRPVGAAVVRATSGFPFPLTSIVEPRRGQTYAYNTGFAAASGVPGTDYVAVLDDDEYPATTWLTELIAAAVRYDADIVGGPVFPVFVDAGHWLTGTGLYAPRRYVTGPVEMIYGAGNMLIRRDVLTHYLDEPFSHAFAFTGGSDLDFFTRCRKDGRSFAWADDARVFETVPRSRTTISWLLLRGFRSGTDRTRIDRSFAQGIGDMTRRWVKGAGLFAFGIGLLPLAALRGRCAVVSSLVVAARGVGRIAAEFNLLYEEYR